MKLTQLLPVLGIAILFTACKKSSSVNGSTTLEGKWELRTTWGSAPLTTYPAGNGNQYHFTNSHYVLLEKNETKASGTFAIVKDNAVSQTVGLIIPEGQFGSRIEFDANAKQKVFYQFSNDTLYLLQGFFPTDGGVKAGYVRVQ